MKILQAKSVVMTTTKEVKSIKRGELLNLKTLEYPPSVKDGSPYEVIAQVEYNPLVSLEIKGAVTDMANTKEIEFDGHIYYVIESERSDLHGHWNFIKCIRRA